MGCYIDVLVCVLLWFEGMDYDYGIGYGVGVGLLVYEGLVWLLCVLDIFLCFGMILFNEFGYYCEGVFGICIENLIVVWELGSFDGCEMLGFEILMLVFIDRCLIEFGLLLFDECDWLDVYYVWVCDEIGFLVFFEVCDWLELVMCFV